jgi:hypothetical protein
MSRYTYRRSIRRIIEIWPNGQGISQFLQKFYTTGTPRAFSEDF